jgi:UDP-N-acetylglucosamine 2-epimerase (non-hydrolysing)
MSELNIGVIAAQRGGFVRAAPLLAELRERAECQPQFIFAGEEYVSHANSELFRDLGLPYADVIIGASEGTPAQRLAKVMAGCERLATSRKWGALVLVGASHTILGCAVAGARSQALVAHVDAGQRAPGIMGRTSLAAQIDRACGVLPAASVQAHDRLLDEGAPEEAVALSGSLGCDAVGGCIEQARADHAAERAGLTAKRYVLAIIESPDNIEHLANLRKLVELLTQVQAVLPLALSVHRRLVQRLEAWQFAPVVAKLPQVCSIEPRGYVDYLSLLDSARLVLTDVGGVQDEAAFLGVPCLTLAETTDRAATVDSGANMLIGLDAGLAVQAVEALVTNEYAPPPRPAAWDGRASARIVDVLVQAAQRKAQA